MQFSVLSSGSKANSTFIEVGSQRILIDCGLSATQLSKRLLSLGVDPSSINGIIITHEHSDHITGVPSLSRRYKIPVYANQATAEHIESPYGMEHFVTGESFQIGDAVIRPFGIVHDAVDPVGFVIEGEGLKFAQATDLGKVTTVVKEALQGAHAVVLESNHDLGMLYTSHYSWELKQRIASSHGHLSNDVAGRLLAELAHPELFQVVLGHLSENCNTPDTALSTVAKYVSDSIPMKNITCGSVANPTPLYNVVEVAERMVVGGV
jgi:phosphoribosyl 1,2-cyclic phosphodiesterase